MVLLLEVMGSKLKMCPGYIGNKRFHNKTLTHKIGRG